MIAGEDPLVIVNVSPHLLMDVATCGTKAWVRHVRGYTSREDAIKAVAGQAFHVANRVYLAPMAIPCSSAVAVEAFRQVYEPAHTRLAPEQLEPAYTPENLARVLARWCEMHPPSVLPWRRVIEVEKAFCSREWRIGETTVRLIVRPDAIVEDAAGFVRWVDRKTTGWRIADAGWQRSVMRSLQALLYTDAVVRRFGDRAALGGWIDAMELRALPKDPKRVCGEHKTPYAECGDEHAKSRMLECLHTPELIQQALGDAWNAAYIFLALRAKNDLAPSDVRGVDMRGESDGACRFCFAGPWCDASRPLMGEGGRASLEGFFVHEPWVIEEGERA